MRLILCHRHCLNPLQWKAYSQSTSIGERGIKGSHRRYSWTPGEIVNGASKLHLVFRTAHTLSIASFNPTAAYNASQALISSLTYLLVFYWKCRSARPAQTKNDYVQRECESCISLVEQGSKEEGKRRLRAKLDKHLSKSSTQ
jgi:hypothetical protein